MVQNELYNVRDPPWKGSEKQRKNTVAIKIILVPHRTVNSFSYFFFVLP